MNFSTLRNLTILEGKVSIIARGAEILWKKSPNYIELEYIESTGTQWIDTGLRGKNGYDFEYKVNFTSLSASTATGIGGCWESGKSFYLGMVRTNHKLSYHYNGTTAPIEVQTVTANTDYTVSGHMHSGSQYFVVNGTKSTERTLSGSFTSTINVWLFGLNSSSPLYSHMKMYYCKIYDNGVLVRDFIPVLDANGVACLYDKVTEQCFYNRGTGNFLYGEKPTAPYKTELEYLEGTGTQYIDTGKYAPLNTDIEVKFQLNATTQSASNNGAIFGGRNNTTSNTCTLFYLASTNPQYFRFDRTGQVIVATNQQMTIDTNSVYVFSYTGNQTIKTTNLTTGQEEVRQVNNPSSFTTNPISLFAVGGGTFLKGRIYEWKYWEDGVLVQHLIPVLDWDDHPCMYDKVSGELFYNQGTGEFIYA